MYLVNNLQYPLSRVLIEHEGFSVKSLSAFKDLWQKKKLNYL